MSGRSLFAAAVLSLFAGQALAASPYSAIYSFGDSLSDAGNLYLLSGDPANQIPHQPLWPYWQGRFSNGNVWVQDLSKGLGLGQVTPSLLGGNDYAFGGATTGATDAHQATLIDLPTQIAAFQAYLALHPGVDATTALYTVSIGANDIFALLKALQTGTPVVDPTTVIDEAAANLASAASVLRGDGAKDLVLFDVPDLGLTPAFNTSPYSGLATGFATEFNAQVLTDLAPVEAAGLTVYDLDTFDLIDEAVAHPGDYGFSNATLPCWTGTATGGTQFGDPLLRHLYRAKSVPLLGRRPSDGGWAADRRQRRARGARVSPCHLHP